MFIIKNYNQIYNSIQSLDKNSRLIVVTKNQDFMNIKPIIDEGHLHFGENSLEY